MSPCRRWYVTEYCWAKEEGQAEELAQTKTLGSLKKPQSGAPNRARVQGEPGRKALGWLERPG